MVAKSTNAARKDTVPAKQARPAFVPGGSAPEIDRLIHEPIRLRIVSALRVNESLTFSELKKLLDTTDGNLSIHARKLEDAGYVSCEKSFEGRVPKTEYRLTPEGRKVFDRYLDHMEALVKALRR